MKSNQITQEKDTTGNGTLKIDFPENQSAMQLFGEHNRHLKKLSSMLDLTISARGNTAFIQGDPIDAQLARNILEQLYGLVQDGYPIHSNDIDYAGILMAQGKRRRSEGLKVGAVLKIDCAGIGATDTAQCGLYSHPIRAGQFGHGDLLHLGT